MEILSQTHNSRTVIHQHDGKITVAEQVNVDQNIDRVQRLRHHAVRSDLLGDCVASIPLAAIAQWGQQFGIDIHEVMNDDALLDRCIADYGAFKVKGGYL